MIRRWYRKFILKEFRRIFGAPEPPFSIMLVKGPDYYQLCLDSNFVPTQNYPRVRTPLEGEVGTMKGFRLVMSEKVEHFDND